MPVWLPAQLGKPWRSSAWLNASSKHLVKHRLRQRQMRLRHAVRPWGRTACWRHLEKLAATYLVAASIAASRALAAFVTMLVALASVTRARTP